MARKQVFFRPPFSQMSTALDRIRQESVVTGIIDAGLLTYILGIIIKLSASMDKHHLIWTENHTFSPVLLCPRHVRVETLRDAFVVVNEFFLLLL